MAVFYEKALKDMTKVLENPDTLRSISAAKINEGGLGSRLQTASVSSSLEVGDPASGLNPAPELIKRMEKYKGYSDNAEKSRQDMINRIKKEEGPPEKPSEVEGESNGLMTPTGKIDFDEGMLEFATAALADVESKGSGGYSAVGDEVTKGMYKGERALGKYQVMPSNVAGWTKKHFGKTLTPEEFLASPDAQEAVVQGELMSNFQKYGTIEDAISIWFTGKPLKKAIAAGASDQNTSVQNYLNKWTSSFNKYVSEEEV
mgnify:CR=1 FL=1